MKICFRNISPAKLKWKECPRRIKQDCFSLYYRWFKLDISISSSLDSFFYLVLFIANCCHLLSFLKNHKIVISLVTLVNFSIISNLFHHKYNDKNFSKGNEKPVSPRNQFCQQNQFPDETSPPAKPAPRWDQPPHETEANPPHTGIPRKSNTPTFLPLSCFAPRLKKSFRSDRLIFPYWSVLRKFFFQKLIFYSIRTNLW